MDTFPIIARQVEWTSSFIRREDIYKNKDKIYLFGDNILGKGGGGMAGEMRGEINSLGIPTKKYPSMKEDSFFTDFEFNLNVYYIFRSFLRIPKNKDIVVPKNIGKGLAQLDIRAPKTYKYMTKLLSSLVDGKFTWVDDLTNPKDGLIIYTIHSYLINKKAPDVLELIPKIN